MLTTDEIDTKISQTEESRFFLQVSNPYCSPSRWALRLEREKNYRAGRLSGSDIILYHPSVSRNHFEITWHGDDLVIQDLGSRNGTRVNNQSVQGEIALHPGDLIQISDLELKILEASDELLRSMPIGPVAPAQVTLHGNLSLGSFLADKRRSVLETLVYLLLGCAAGLILFFLAIELL